MDKTLNSLQDELTKEVNTLQATDPLQTQSYDTSDKYFKEDEDLGIENKADTHSGRLPTEDESPISFYDPEDLTDTDVDDIKAGKYDDYLERLKEPLADMSFLDKVHPENLPATALGTYAGYVEASKAMASGLAEAGENILESGAALLDSAIGLGYDMEDPNYWSNVAKSVEVIPPEWTADWDKTADKSTGLQLTKNFTQFLAPFGSAMKLLKVYQKSGKMPTALEKMVGAGTVGAITDFAVWDYTDKRLVDFMESFGSELKADAEKFTKDPEDYDAFNAMRKGLGEALTSKYITMLKYDPKTDSELMARTKQALEGFFIGNVVDAVMHTVGLYGRLKASRIAKTADEAEKVNQITIKGGGKTDTLVGETPQATIKIPDIDVPEQVYKDFNTAIFTKNKDAATAVLGKAIAPALREIKGVDYLPAFQDLVDELVENAKYEARQMRSASKAKAAQSGKNENVARANPEAYVEANAADDLVPYNSFAKDLDTLEFKAGVVDYAMGLHLSKALRAFNKNQISLDQMQEVANYSAFISEQVRNPRSNMGAAFREIQNSKYVTNEDGSFKKDQFGRRIQKLTATNLLKNNRLAKADETLYRKLALQVENLDLDNVETATALTNAIKERDFLGAWGEAFINSALGPKTLGVQFISNGVIMATKTADVWLAAARSGKGATGLKTISYKQATANTLGMLAGIFDGIKVMVKSFVTDKAEFSRSVNYVNEYAPRHKITSQNLGFYKAKPGSPAAYFNKSIDMIGKILRGLPGATRSMMASDEMFKVINHRAYVYQQAMRETEQAFSITKQPKEFMEAFQKRLEDILKADKYKAKLSPTDAANFRIHQEAMESAHFATLTNKWGDKGEKVYQAIRDVPFFTFIVPFVRAPLNAALWVGRTTPGLNLTPIGSRISEELAAGGVRAEMARAHLQAASLLWTFAMMQAFNHGDKLQGSAFTGDSREYRDMGIERTTFQNEKGDFVNYRGYEPQSARWALAANLMHQWMSTINKAGDQLSDHQVQEAVNQLIWDSSIYVMADFKDRSAFQGIERLVSMFDEGSVLRAEGVVEGFLSGWISILSSQIKFIREQYLGEKQVKFDPDTLSEHIDSRYGGALSALGIVEPPVVMLNSFGDPVPGSHPRTPLGFLPSNITDTKGFEHPAHQEILRVKQALPNETVLGTVPTRYKNIKINNRERHNLLKFAKHFKDENGHDMNEAFMKVFNSKMYKKQTDVVKAEIINKMYRARLNVGMQLMILDGFAFNKGIPRPYASKMELEDYRRDDALSQIAQREHGAKINRRLPGGKDHRKYIDLDQRMEKVDKEYSREFKKARAIFRNLTK